MIDSFGRTRAFPVCGLSRGATPSRSVAPRLGRCRCQTSWRESGTAWVRPADGRDAAAGEGQEVGEADPGGGPVGAGRNCRPAAPGRDFPRAERRVRGEWLLPAPAAGARHPPRLGRFPAAGGGDGPAVPIPAGNGRGTGRCNPAPTPLTRMRLTRVPDPARPAAALVPESHGGGPQSATTPRSFAPRPRRGANPHTAGAGADSMPLTAWPARRPAARRAPSPAPPGRPG